MNTQNIFRYYGTKLNLKLDSSEFYDYQLGENLVDYNTEVLETNPIEYESLRISNSLNGATCERLTISLTEIDNRINDQSYPYSGLSLTVDYDLFVNHISESHKNTILNSDIYTYTGITNEIHYFEISDFNEPKLFDSILGEREDLIIEKFSKDIITCFENLNTNDNCCPITNNLNNKPWSYQFITPNTGCTESIIQRRTEKGWTLDFIFNRNSLSWSEGGVFYYFGTRGTSDNYELADNNLSFKFTSDGRIQWTSLRYKNICTPSGDTENFIIESGSTVQLCTSDPTKDFNVTIVFDRYKRLTDCDVENRGGWNDLVGTKIIPYTDLDVTGVTSTQITLVDNVNERLTKKWSEERENRLGVLKIYLNGRPIYKIEDWEEIVPSKRGLQPFIQSWGGGDSSVPYHSGVCCFNMKNIQYYEEPLDFPHVYHNFQMRKNQYDFNICGQVCEDELLSILNGYLLGEDGSIFVTENNEKLIY
jgi:hypothetical protein